MDKSLPNNHENASKQISYRMHLSFFFLPQKNFLRMIELHLEQKRIKRLAVSRKQPPLFLAHFSFNK